MQFFKKYFRRYGRFFLKAFEIFGKIAGVILFLLISLIILIRLPIAQQVLVEEAVGFLNQKLNTAVSLESIYIDFPKNLVLRKLYVEDLQKDTLLYADKIGINAELFAVLQNRVAVSDLELSGVTGKLIRYRESGDFNFDFIAKTFDNPDKDKSASEPMEFEVDDLLLTDIRFLYHDRQKKDSMLIEVDKLGLEIRDFDLQGRKVYASSVDLNGAMMGMELNDQNEPDTSSAQEEVEEDVWEIMGDEIHLTDVGFDFHMVNEIRFTTRVDRIAAGLDDFDLEGQLVDAGFLEIDGVHYALELLENSDTAENAVEEVPDYENRWEVSSNRLSLKNGWFKFDNWSSPPVEEGFDPLHLHFKDINFSGRDGFYNPDSIAGIVDKASLSSEGLTLRNLSTHESYFTFHAAATKNLKLETERSAFGGDFTIRGYSLPVKEETLKDILIDFAIDSSYLNIGEALYFQPSLADSFPLPDHPLEIGLYGQIRGSLDSLLVKDFNVSSLDTTQFDLTAEISGLPDMDSLTFDIEKLAFITKRDDMQKIIPDSLQPSVGRFPKWLRLTANAEGTLEDLKGQLSFNSSAGFFSAGISGKKEIKKDAYNFESTLKTETLNLGSLLDNPALGRLTGNFSINGSYLDSTEYSVDINASISSVSYREYAYNDIVVKGVCSSDKIEGDIQIDDNNFLLDARVDLNFEDPRHFKVEIDKLEADLYAVNMAEEQYKVRATAKMDFAVDKEENLNGRMAIYNVTFLKNNKIYNVDSLVAISISDKDKKEISIQSDALDAYFNGNIHLQELPQTLMAHFDHYFTVDVQDNDGPSQAFDFSIELKNSRILTQVLVEELHEFGSGLIKGKFNSEEHRLDFQMELPGMVYGQNEIDSLVFTINSNPSELNFDLSIDQTEISSFQIAGINLKGKVYDGELESLLSIGDSNKEARYSFENFVYKDSGAVFIKFKDEGLILDQQSWNVNSDHYIKVGTTGYWINNFKLFKGAQQVFVDTRISKWGYPTTLLKFSEFGLDIVGKSGDNSQHILAGRLNGRIQVKNDLKAFTSKLDISNFSFKGDTLGNVELQASNTGQTDKYRAKLHVEGKGNDMTVQGFYQIEAPSNIIDLNANFNHINLATFEAFAGEELKNLAGKAAGQMSIKGPVDAPDIKGNINFDTVTFNVSFLNTPMHINDESLNFTGDRIVFDQFVVLDNTDDPTTFNGYVAFEDFSKFNLNLDITTDKFQLLDTKPGDNELYYGYLSVNSDIKARGTAVRPDVSLDLSFEEGSHLTYVIPPSEVEVARSEGVVTFIDRDHEDDPFYSDIEQSQREDTLGTELLGVDLSANLNIDKDVSLSILVDPESGDNLTLRGEGNLDVAVNPEGAIDIRGRYDIVGGHYKLNFYQIAKREFEIQDGSYVIWNGDPLGARMNIRALYRVNAPASGLVEGETGTFTQSIPFLVYVNINGTLNDPVITFDINMPEAQQGIANGVVYSRIQQLNQDEKELNKQVFSLIVFRRFMAEDPLSGGGGIEQSARNSVSRILSNQLNRLSQNIKGVELSFDIDSYNTQSAGRTELELGLSKQFFDDRLLVKVAGNFDLEGEQRNQRSLSDFAGDILVQYKLTDDGRLRLEGFRKNRTEELVQGEVTETGVGVIYIRNYDQFSELFNLSSKAKK